MIKFTVYDEKIIPKQSARFCKFRKAYQPQKVIRYADRIRYSFLDKYPNFQPYEKGIALNVLVVAYFQTPKAMKKADKEKAENGYLKKTTRPDTDNITKIVKDALNGVAYADDSQVVLETVIKGFNEVEKLEVYIKTDNIKKSITEHVSMFSLEE